jgi:hypothetical protein
MIGLAVAAVLGGMSWAKINIHKDVSELYSTRPLSSQQIDVLNQELKQIKKAQMT